MQILDGVDELLDGHQVFVVQDDLLLAATFQRLLLGDGLLLQLQALHQRVHLRQHLVDLSKQPSRAFGLAQVELLQSILLLKTK